MKAYGVNSQFLRLELGSYLQSYSNSKISIFTLRTGFIRTKLAVPHSAQHRQLAKPQQQREILIGLAEGYLRYLILDSADGSNVKNILDMSQNKCFTIKLIESISIGTNISYGVKKFLLCLGIRFVEVGLFLDFTKIPPFSLTKYLCFLG